VISTELVAQTILESGGQRAGDIIDVVARKVGHAPVQLRLSEVKRILGKEIPAAEIERMLSKLGFKLTAKGAGAYSVVIPTWRLDVEREIDVIEEIARVHGYDKFPNTLPSFSEGVVELPTQEKDDKLRSTLLALGYNEALSSTFIAREESQCFSKANPVIIANPLSEEASAMRTTLVPGMLEMMGRNLNRGVNEVRLFEHGHIYSTQAATTDEHDSLCMGVTASALTRDAHTAFRALKGDIEDLLSAFAGSLSFDAETPGYFHPGRSARAKLNGTPVAHFGQISSDVASARKLKQDVYLAEILIEQLYRTDLRRPRYQKISRFPAVERDFSFLFSDEVSFAQIAGAIIGLRIPELRSVQPEEIFRGGNLAQGKYSVLVRTTFQSNERTLRDNEVNTWSAQIIDTLKSLGGQQR
jgi:phenylalanyl-tRNA synthetase beta chain